MVRPILKMLMSPDLFDIDDGGSPGDPDSFAIFVQCLIGEDGPAADTFDFVALSPDKVADELPDAGVLSGRALLVMRRYDPDLLRSTVSGWCREAEAADWETSAARLCRYMRWEYEDGGPDA